MSLFIQIRTSINNTLLSLTLKMVTTSYHLIFRSNYIKWQYVTSWYYFCTCVIECMKTVRSLVNFCRWRTFCHSHPSCYCKRRYFDNRKTFIVLFLVGFLYSRGQFAGSRTSIVAVAYFMPDSCLCVLWLRRILRQLSTVSTSRVDGPSTRLVETGL